MLRYYYMLALLLLSLSAIAAETPVWSSLGPGVFGAMWGVAFHPTDPNTLIAGLDMGIACITRDGGKSWAVMGEMGKTPMGQPAYRGGWGMQFDPKRPEIIWIASEHGISKSEDGGKHWRLLLGGPPTCYCPIAIDPTDTSIVYVGEGRSVRVGVAWTTGYIHKTTDGGKTWTHLRPGGPLADDTVKARNWTRILIDPQSPFVAGKGHQRLYAAGQGGFFLSEDAGETWTSLEEHIPGGVVDLAKVNEYGGKPVHTSGICDLALVRGNGHNILFATFQVVQVPDGKKWRGGVYRSDDGGLTWVEKNAGLEPILAYMSTDDYHRMQGLAFAYSTIAVAPSDPNVLYFGCNGRVSKSVDQGEHWTTVTHPENEWRKIPTPDGKTMYAHVRKPGGNYRNASWGSIAAFNGLAVSPVNAGLVAYTDNNGVGLSADGGQNWDEPLFEYGEAYKPGKFGDLAPMRLTHRTRAHGVQLVVPNALAFDPFDAKTLAAGYYDIGLQISRDGGAWWEWGWEGIYPFDEQNNIRTAVYDPQVKGRLFIGTGRNSGGGKVYQSDDGGSTFRVIGISQLAGQAGVRVNELALDPTSPPAARVLYAATNKGIFKTADGGQTWQDCSKSLGTATDINRLAMDPKNPQRLYAGSDAYAKATPDAGLYRSDDGGLTWTRLAADRLGGIRTISICRDHPEVLVVAAQQPGQMGTWSVPTLWRSTDSGDTWQQLDKRRCSCAAVHPSNPDTIYMGLWAFDIAKEPVGLYRTLDGGKSWTPLDQGTAFTIGFLNNDRILFDPRDPRRLYVLTSTGILTGVDPAGQ